MAARRSSTRAPSPEPSAPEPNTDYVDVVLVKDHTHAGRDYEPGEILNVRRNTADFMILVGAAKLSGQ